MAKQQVTVAKVHADQWQVANTATDVVADIVRFEDTNGLTGRTKMRYRVDMSGRTVASMLDTLAEAKKIARGKVM